MTQGIQARISRPDAFLAGLHAVIVSRHPVSGHLCVYAAEPASAPRLFYVRRKENSPGNLLANGLPFRAQEKISFTTACWRFFYTVCAYA